MAMSKKDFEAIALAIRAAGDPASHPEATAVREFVAYWIARHAQATNPTFEPTRFFDAAGVKGHG